MISLPGQWWPFAVFYFRSWIGDKYNVLLSGRNLLNITMVSTTLAVVPFWDHIICDRVTCLCIGMAVSFVMVYHIAIGI